MFATSLQPNDVFLGQFLVRQRMNPIFLDDLLDAVAGNDVARSPQDS